jgi:NtrC-family two-component system response regulator AlgB
MARNTKVTAADLPADLNLPSHATYGLGPAANSSELAPAEAGTARANSGIGNTNGHGNGNGNSEGTPAWMHVGARVSLEQLEEAHIRAVLARSHSLVEAAELLGIDQATLYRKRKKLGLS